MSSQVSTLAPRTAASTIVTLSLRLAAALLAVAGAIKVAQTGVIVFALVLVVPWVVVAARSRPGPRAALTAVIVGTLELTLAGSRFAAGGSIEWFDSGDDHRAHPGADRRGLGQLPLTALATRLKEPA